MCEIFAKRVVYSKLLLNMDVQRLLRILRGGYCMCRHSVHVHARETRIAKVTLQPCMSFGRLSKILKSADFLRNYFQYKAGWGLSGLTQCRSFSLGRGGRITIAQTQFGYGCCAINAPLPSDPLSGFSRGPIPRTPGSALLLKIPAKFLHCEILGVRLCL